MTRKSEWTLQDSPHILQRILSLTCPSVLQSGMTAIGSQVQVRLEEKLRHLEDFARGIQNLVGSQPLLRKHARGSSLACVPQPSSQAWEAAEAVSVVSH